MSVVQGRRRWIALAALAPAVVVVFGAMTGNVGLAASAFIKGSVGSVDAVASSTLVRSVPLILSGLSVAWAFTAGVFNIGVEGQFRVGASAAAAIGLMYPSGSPVDLALTLLAGSVAGAAWAGIAAWLRSRFQVLEVISTIMLNFVALQLVSYLVHGPLGDPRGIYPQSPAIAASARLPQLAPGTRLHWGLGLDRKSTRLNS